MGGPIVHRTPTERDVHPERDEKSVRNVPAPLVFRSLVVRRRGHLARSGDGEGTVGEPTGVHGSCLRRVVPGCVCVVSVF